MNAESGERLLEILAEIGIKATVYRALNGQREEVVKARVPQFEIKFVHRKPAPPPEPTVAEKVVQIMKAKKHK